MGTFSCVSIYISMPRPKCFTGFAFTSDCNLGCSSQLVIGVVLGHGEFVLRLVCLFFNMREYKYDIGRPVE